MEQLLLPYFAGEAMEELFYRPVPQPLTLKQMASRLLMPPHEWADFMYYHYYNPNQLELSFMNPHKTYLAMPKNPIRKVLRAMTGKKPPKFVKGYDYSNLTDMQHQELQDWAATNARPTWLTGIGLIEAAEKQVQEAVDNANIPPKEPQ
jgi:hypothetical protein